ncbi:MAG TPA: AAA family ATPase [Opitutaceae bacterium]|nr:AAA family ATPase [Opitutaceae bacterium]
MSPLPSTTAFIGRGALLRRLGRLYHSSRHVLLLGPSGAGKSMLLAEFARTHPLLFAPRCNCLGELLAALEPAAGLDRDNLRLAARVHRLATRLPRIGRPIVIDNAARVPPRVAHLLRALMLRQPVWLVTRSTQPLEIGHVWPYLFFFRRVELPPFSFAETQAFLAAADLPGDRAELLASALRLHRLAAGHPATLAALVDELRARNHDLQTTKGLRLLALHARITGVARQLAADAPALTLR